MPPLAYFITWTCYGTWLHGDDRGSVDDLHNRYRTPYLPPSDVHHTLARAAMAERPWTMSDADRADVRTAIERALDIRGWTLHALNVRTNHVHIVITAPDQTPEHACAILKTWATRTLKDSGRHTARRKFWTNQASTRHLLHERALEDAIRYVRYQ